MSRKTGPNRKKMLVTSPQILIRLGLLIKQRRSACGIPRVQLCEKLCISNSQLTCWEKGKAEPRFGTLLRICSILMIEFDEILKIYEIDDVSVSHTGDLFAKYNSLLEESQEHVEAVINAMLICDVVNRINDPHKS